MHAGTVLLVEDEDTVRQLLRRVLEKHGYTVLHAENATEARAVSEQFRGGISVLLTDIVMPGESGLEVANAMRVSRPETPVLFMSAHPESTIAAMHGSFPAGTHFINKPFTSAELLKAIAIACRRS